MASFHFYNFALLPSTDAPSSEVPLSTDHLAQLLEEHLSQAAQEPMPHLSLYADHGVAGTAMVHNTIETHCGAVTLLRLRNQKAVGIVPLSGTEEQTLDSYPCCWAIIDSRPASLGVLIEKQEAVFDDTAQVADILAAWVNHHILPSDSLHMCVLQQCLYKGDIWDLVSQRVHSHRDRLTAIHILMGKRQPNPNCEVDQLMQMLVSRFAALNGEIQLPASQGTANLFNTKNKDLANLVAQLVAHDYTLRMTFAHTGQVEYGQHVGATYIIPDEQLTAFGKELIDDHASGRTTYELIITLDSIAAENNDKTYGKTIFRPRRNGTA